MSLERLIRDTFDAGRPEYFVLRGPTGFLNHQFKADVVEKFGWELLGFRKVQAIIDGEKHYSMEAAGIVKNAALRAAFTKAGYADSFIFSAPAEVRKRAEMNYSDPLFDPATAVFDIRIAVSAGAAEPKWIELNREIESYLVLAKLGAL